jgi:adenine phosphoribosyltransferase
MVIKDLYSHLRIIPNYPEVGHNFYDISALLENNEALRLIIEELGRPYEGITVDKIVGVDTRGLLLAAPLAFYLGCGLATIRSQSGSPLENISEIFEAKSETKKMLMHIDAVKAKEKVVIIDDVLATGDTTKAIIDLVHQAEAEIIGISFLAELSYLHGKENISHFPVYSILTFDE